jgi:tetratricopeptide (TPR) repeat protein
VVDLLVAAAKEARSRFFFEESIGHYRRAVELLGPDEPRRARIGLDLGLQLHHFGERDEAWRVFAEVAGIAMAGDDVDVLVRSALTVYGLSSPEGRAKLQRDLVHAAHRRLFDGVDPPSDATLDQLAQEVIMRLIAIARDGGDDDTLGFSLWTQHDQLWGMGHAAERLALTDELAGIARRTGDNEMEQYAVSLGWVAKLEMDDPSYHERYLSFLHLVEIHPQSTIVIGSYIDRAIIATFQGRFAEAEAHLAAARAVPEKPAQQEHFEYLDHHLVWACLQLQGRYDDLAELRPRAEKVKHPFPALIDGVTAASRGDAATADRCLAELEALRERPSSAYEPLVVRLRAEAAIASGDPVRCAEVAARLAPHAGTWLVSMYGCDLSGPVTLWLGRLALVRGLVEDAVRLLEEARDSADKLGSRPWSLEARASLAAALGDDELRASVSAEAAALGMHHLRSAPVSAPGNEFRLAGDTWTLSMAGRTVHMPDSKGLRDLHVLLRMPGKEIPASRLLNPAGGQETAASASLGGDTVLDDEARAAYRRRLSTLDEQIESATLRGDDTRAAAYDEEREALLTELRTATGLGGRTRRLGDEAERARKTVTARIRDTLRKLDTRHPELATHLRATVSTGSTCTYTPDPKPAWHL